MHFSLLSKSDSNNRIIISAVTWLFRIITGTVFIVSGFVKAIDPWGSLYKFEEYTAAMGMPVLHALLLAGVFALCALEFMIGVILTTGCYRKSCPVVALIFIVIMLALTLWIALYDPVSDCGCFGDFIILSNWATFWKNVVLAVMILWLVKYNLEAITIISPAFQWMAFVISLVFVTTVSILGYTRQPLIDFRPYKTGGPFVNMTDEADNDSGSDFRFVYEKDGERKEFGVDDELPSEEDGWIFVERIDIMPDKTATVSDSDSRSFRLWDKEGNEDMTAEAVTQGKQLLLLIPDLPGVSPATTWKINELYDWATRHDAEMIAAVSGTSAAIAEWEDLSMPQYDIYTCDDTAIKEVARGNPAVVYVDDNRIIWKSSLGSLDIDIVSEHGDTIRPEDFATDSHKELINLVYLFMICMAVPLTLSMLPRIKDAYTARKTRRKNITIHDDTALPGE